MSHYGILLATGFNSRNIINNCCDKFSNVMFGGIVVFVILNFTVEHIAEEDIFFSCLVSIVIQHGRLVVFLVIIFTG